MAPLAVVVQAPKEGFPNINYVTCSSRLELDARATEIRSHLHFRLSIFRIQPVFWITSLSLPMAKHPRSRPKLQIGVTFSLLLVLFSLLVSFMLPCKHCQPGFSALSSRGLMQHQKKCEAFLKHEAAANERRKVTTNSNKIRQTKLNECKVHLGTATPGVSFHYTQ